MEGRVGRVGRRAVVVCLRWVWSGWALGFVDGGSRMADRWFEDWIGPVMNGDLAVNGIWEVRIEAGVGL